MLLTYPLMVAIQEISGRIGRITGHGIAGNVCRNYSAPVIWSLVILLFVANTINVAADLGAMADATKLLMGGWSPLYVVAYAVVSVAAQIFVNYKRYVAVLKWLTLVLFAYVIALAIVHVPWDEALRGLLIPKIQFDGSFLTTLIAILGTTISPYLFIWQSSQEAEEQRIDPKKRPLREESGWRWPELRRIRIDTMVGMAFSNLIAIAIIITTAATLHSNGIFDIQSSAQAADSIETGGRGLCRTGLCAWHYRHWAFGRFRCWRARPPMRSAKDANGPSALPVNRKRRSLFIPCSRSRWGLP